MTSGTYRKVMASRITNVRGAGLPAARTGGAPVSRKAAGAALRTSLVDLMTLGAQIALLCGIFALCDFTVSRLHLRVPGNIVGMLLLFTLLATGIVKERWVAGAADILTRHLAFFFIPIAVGLMEWAGVLWQSSHWLLLAIVVSSVAGMLTAGGTIQLLAARGDAQAR